MDSSGSTSFEAISAANLPLGIEPAPDDARPGSEQSGLLQSPSPPALASHLHPNALVIDLTNDADPSPSTSRRLLPPPRPAVSDSDNEVIFAGQNAAPVPARRTHRPPARRDSPMVPHAEPSARPQSAFMGPSRILIRETPPPYVRRNPNPTATFGGGGRVSGGYFSGLVASGIHSFRDLARLTTRERDEPAEPNRFLERIFMDWTGTNGPNQNNGHRGRDLIAAVFDFGPNEFRHAPIESTYIEAHSHPHRIKAGFSKEIIPLDREFLTLDSDSQDIVPVKQEARPVCASCDDPLLLGQASSTSTTEGRRPWILACGHVVDSKCLEMARDRARAARKAKTAKSKAKSSRGRGGRKKRPASSLPDDPALNPTIKGPSASTSSKRSRLDSTSSSPKLNSASTRATRALARDARRSDFFGILPQSPVTQPPELVLPDSSHAESSDINKGKGKELEDLPDIGTPFFDIAPDGSVVSPVLDLPLMMTWIQCPVKDCKGPKGDVLAKKGTKTAPWEIFV